MFAKVWTGFVMLWSLSSPTTRSTSSKLMRCSSFENNFLLYVSVNLSHKMWSEYFPSILRRTFAKNLSLKSLCAIDHIYSQLN